MTKTTDLHIVIEARRFADAPNAYRAMTPPIEWADAQLVAERLDREHGLTHALRSRGYTGRYYMVRSVADPRWAFLDLPRVRRSANRSTARDNITKVLAADLGIVGRSGGWLYRGDSVICQGWSSLSRGYIAGGGIVEVPRQVGDKVSTWYAPVTHFAEDPIERAALDAAYGRSLATA